MTDLLLAIENSGFPTWVRESPSLMAYTLVLSLHAMGLAIVAGLSVAVNLRLLGFAPEIPLAPARKLFPLMYLGFWVNAISGLALFAANATGLIENTMFFIKLAFVAAAVIIMRFLRSAVLTDAALASEVLPDSARILAVASLFCWLGAVVAGRLTSYPWMVETYFGI